MRVLIDYRPALRQRSGVGEYAHELVRALLAGPATRSEPALSVTLFSSSWKDRLAPTPDIASAAAIDLRVPVRLLNLAWHRLEWPPVEQLARQRFDVTHSLHPLLMPTTTAAQVVTIYDLHFLASPGAARAEIRRDYPSLARAHAQRADHIIVSSSFTAREVATRLDVPPGKISVCYPGAPRWAPRSQAPADGYILFLGTLEPRKNVGALLDAYERLIQEPRTAARVPHLVLGGHAPADAAPLLERLARAPLHGRARHVGYVDDAKRRDLYCGASLLVLPSLDEGFGLPLLEAMAVGVPVVASNRGAMPEVLAGAGVLVEPDPDSIAAGIRQLLDDPARARRCAEQGLARAAQFRWEFTAERVCEAYREALRHRRCGSA